MTPLRFLSAGKAVLAAFLSAGLASAAVAAEKFDWIEFYFDKKPTVPYALRGGIYVGAEVQVDTEGEFNLNLDRENDEDEVVTSPELQVNVLYDDEGWIRAYLEMQISRDVVHRSPDDQTPDTKLELTEAYFTLFPDGRNVGLTLGRWSVSDEREWLFDEDLDGAQIAWRSENFAFEAMYAREQLFQKDLLGVHERDNPDYFYARLYAQPFDGAVASIYGLHQSGRKDDSRSLTWIGGSVIGETDSDIDYWLDAATVFGKEDGRDVNGFGFDAGLTKAFPDVAMRPRLTASLAFGSGDDGDDSDSAFRQTGIQGNGSRFGGRKSFKYYGEVLDPELSNLWILTLGAGVNVSEKTTVDLIYHRYSQHIAFDEIRDSALDEDPSGDDRHIGDEIDLVIGFREFEKFDIDLIGGVFFPGAAFDGNNDPAYFAALEVKYTF